MKYKILKLAVDSKYQKVYIHLLNSDGNEEHAILDIKKFEGQEIEGRILKKRVRDWFEPEPTKRWKIESVRL